MPEKKLPIIILHGWSGTSESITSISTFLRKSGYTNIVDIWLSDYLSMNDEITINDLGQAMGNALRANKISEQPRSFDVIVHSTGGLVIRSYLKQYFYRQPEKCPIKHLVMLAPANFGSPIAHAGKSMLGRLLKGWKWNGLFQTGTRILQALDMASPFSWELANDDLFNSENQIFRTKNLFTTILVGSSAYDGIIGSIHKNGSDGTVYASTANLNSRSIKIDFYSSGKVKELPPCYDPIAFGVLFDINHRTILFPEENSDLANFLLQGLSIENETEYDQHLNQLKEITKNTFAKGLGSEDEKERKMYHQYQNVVVRVHDQFNEPVEDYFLEFFQEEKDKKDKVMQKIQAEVLEKAYPYPENKSYRSFLFDITDLQNEILNKGGQVDMSICAAALSERISYINPRGYITVANQSDPKFIEPNTTLLIDIQLDRFQSEKVFRLKKLGNL